MPKYPEKNLSQCPSVYHKSHSNLRGKKPANNRESYDTSH